MMPEGRAIVVGMDGSLTRFFLVIPVQGLASRSRKEFFEQCIAMFGIKGALQFFKG
jgi:hypothetical protein